MKQHFAAREERRQEQGARERETGEIGVFALVNQQLGDNSEAARIQRQSQEGLSKSMSQQSYGRFDKPQQVRAPQDRKSLMASQVRLSALPLFCHRLGHLFRLVFMPVLSVDRVLRSSVHLLNALRLMTLTLLPDSGSKDIVTSLLTLKFENMNLYRMMWQPNGQKLLSCKQCKLEIRKMLSCSSR